MSVHGSVAATKRWHPYKILAPFQVHYTDHKGAKKTFLFNEGMSGVAYMLDSKKQVYELGLPDGNPSPKAQSVQVAVADDLIKINRNVNIFRGDWTISFSNPALGPFQPPRAAAKGPLWRAIHSFCHSLNRSSTMKGLLSPRLVALLETDHKISNFCDLVCDGAFRAGLLELFDSRTFTLNNIMAQARQCRSDNWEKKSPSSMPVPCVYLFVHTMPNGSVVVYTGSTNDLGRRCGQHHHAAKKDGGNSMHYRHFRDAVTSRCYIVCVVPKEHHDTGAQLLAELFFMAMGLETYASCMSAQSPEAIKRANTYDMDDKIYDHPTVFESENQDEDNGDLAREEALNFAYEAAGPGEDVERVVNKRTATRHTMQRLAVFHMQHAVRDAKSVSGWPGGTSRSGFSAQSIDGCNMATPLFTDQDVAVLTWSSKEIQKDGQPWMTVFSRPPMTIWADQKNHRNRVTLFQAPKNAAHTQLESGRKGKRVLASWGPEEEPKKGRKVYIEVEIMAPNIAYHPHQWARLPMLDEARDSKLARSLAISLMWQDDNGGWHKRYMQSKLVDQVTHADAPSKPYCEAVSMALSLLEKQVHNGENPIPAYIGWWGPSHVFKQSFDWFNCRLNVLTDANPVRYLLNTEFTRDQRVAQLVAAGALNHGAKHRTVKLGGSRVKCDICSAISSEYKKGHGASESLYGGARGYELASGDPKGKSCVCCYNINNLECTWTPTINKKLMAMLVNSGMKPGALLIDIVEPKIRDLRDPSRQNIGS